MSSIKTAAVALAAATFLLPVKADEWHVSASYSTDQLRGARVGYRTESTQFSFLDWAGSPQVSLDGRPWAAGSRGAMLAQAQLSYIVIALLTLLKKQTPILVVLQFGSGTSLFPKTMRAAGPHRECSTAKASDIGSCSGNRRRFPFCFRGYRMRTSSSSSSSSKPSMMISRICSGSRSKQQQQQQRQQSRSSGGGGNSRMR